MNPKLAALTITYQAITGRSFYLDMLSQLKLTGYKKDYSVNQGNIKGLLRLQHTNGYVTTDGKLFVKRNKDNKEWEVRRYSEPKKHIVLYSSQSLKSMLRVAQNKVMEGKDHEHI